MALSNPRPILLRLLPPAAAVLLLAVPVRAWWPAGHSILAQAALKTLPAEAPAFFRDGGELVGHLAQDPDVAKNRDAPLASHAEFPEHFIDLELLQGRDLPANRYGFLKLCRELQVEPDKVGLAPYATAEWTERLAVAFAEHRRWPESAAIRTKALVYAGILSHYATDLCMPLHTTVHYDGRVASPGAESPRSGIHARVDSLIERLEMKPAELAAGIEPQAYERLLEAVADQVRESHSQVERTYELEAGLPPASGDWTPPAAVRAFATDRARASTKFLGSLYLTAWRRSAKIRLPEWLKR